MKRRSRLTNRPLILAPARSVEELKNTDISQSPDYTVTKTHDEGGLVLTNVEVIAVFWGKYWSGTTPAPSPAPDTYYQAFTGIVTGPYMTGLRQYRGVGPGTMLGKFINDSSDPKNGYGDSDVVDMLTKFLDANPSVPRPDSGHQRFYAVVTPPGLNDNEALGKHVNFTYKGVKAYYCWINSIGGLTDTSSDGVVNTFSHELAEACTDPDGNSVLVDGKKSDGSSISNDEIGDTCNNEFAIVEMNGVHVNVQCYWSEADQACILPLGSLSFLIDKNTFGKDEVQEALDKNYGVFSNAFWLALDGFSQNTFQSFKVEIPTPTGPFANLSFIQVKPSPANPGDPAPAKPIPVYEDPNDPALIQRIRFSFDVIFTKPITSFPAAATQYALTATFKTNGQAVPGANSQETVEFELVAGADPYFSNIDVANNSAVSWLSQDLRVFTITQGQSAFAGDPAAPKFTSGQTPYDYIQSLLGYVNGADAYTTPGSSDHLNGLPGQSGYETGDSSVTPLDSGGHQNYNFAIARVRMRSNVQGDPGEAKDARVLLSPLDRPFVRYRFRSQHHLPQQPRLPWSSAESAAFLGQPPIRPVRQRHSNHAVLRHQPNRRQRLRLLALEQQHSHHQNPGHSGSRLRLRLLRLLPRRLRQQKQRHLPRHAPLSGCPNRLRRRASVLSKRRRR